MCSPLGHCLMGLSASQAQYSKPLVTNFGVFLLIIVSANAADLDFVPGFLIGDINRYHHGISHSLGFALLYASLVCLILARCNPFSSRLVLFSHSALAYSSHLLADWLTKDQSAPFGIPLFWPISSSYQLSPVSLFTNIEHGPYGGSNSAVLDNIFSWHNVWAMTLETIIIGPIFAFLLWRRYRQNQA